MTTLKQNIRLAISVAMMCTKHQSYRLTVTLAEGIMLSLLATGFVTHQANAADSAEQLSSANYSLSATTTTKSNPVVTHLPKLANFGHESPSNDARHMADWIVNSGDNHGMPFVIVDKKDAKVFVFHPDGRLRGAAPALLGLARGDDSVPGIGKQKLSSIRPEERTTPAGRFESALDRDLHGGEILWIDYDDAIAMHPVVTTNIKEQRAQRLATPTQLDNRISYGCINVPAQFFKRVVSPAFTRTNGIVYVLPETRPIQKTFSLFNEIDAIDERKQLQTENQHLPAQPTPQTYANAQ